MIEQDPHSLREKTVSKLREAIIAGFFEPGEQLVERDICAKTNVSRSSLREAFRHLETEGVVESRKGEGVFVKALTLQDVRDIYELRMTLDADAVWYFSERASKEDRLRLKTLTDHVEEISYDDVDRVLTFITEFFSIIYDGAGNELSHNMIRSLQTRISQLRGITSRSQRTRAVRSKRDRGNERHRIDLAEGEPVSALNLRHCPEVGE